MYRLVDGVVDVSIDTGIDRVSVDSVTCRLSHGGGTLTDNMTLVPR